MTFRPRFSISRNSPSFQVEETNVGASGPFEAVLAVILILGGNAIFANNDNNVSHSKTLMREIQGRGLEFTLYDDKGS